MKLSWSLSLCALMSWAGPGTPGLAESPHAAARGDALATARALDELDLARVAEDAGDARLLAALRASLAPGATVPFDAPEDRQVAALAARAAAHARAPEALIVPLAKLACGRDPALAPEAAHALLLLADLLSPSQLVAREVLAQDLEQARRALDCVAQRPLPRADITIALAQLGAKLDSLLR